MFDLVVVPAAHVAVAGSGTGHGDSAEEGVGRFAFRDWVGREFVAWVFEGEGEAVGEFCGAVEGLWEGSEE